MEHHILSGVSDSLTLPTRYLRGHDDLADRSEYPAYLGAKLTFQHPTMTTDNLNGACVLCEISSTFAVNVFLSANCMDQRASHGKLFPIFFLFLMYVLFDFCDLELIIIFQSILEVLILCLSWLDTTRKL